MKKAVSINKFVSLALVVAVLLMLLPTEVKAATVKLNESAVTMYKYMEVQLTLEGAKSVSWSSSNKKIAKVSQKGVVTGVKEGSCKITATDKKTGKKYICKVVVRDVPTRDQSVEIGSKGYTSLGTEFPIVSKFNRFPLVNDGFIDVSDFGKTWWGADTDVDSFSYQMRCAGRDYFYAQGNLPAGFGFLDISDSITVSIGMKHTILRTFSSRLEAVPEEGIYYFCYYEINESYVWDRDHTLLLLANITSTPVEVEQAIFEDAFTDDEHFSKDEWVTVGDCMIQFAYAEKGSLACYKIKEA